MEISETDDDEVKRVCSHCVGEPYLKQQIQADGTAADCSYCKGEGSTITIEALADHIDRAFEDHYSLTKTEPDDSDLALQSDRELDCHWEREGSQSVYAIADAAEIDESIAEDVRVILEVRHSDFDSTAMGLECGFEPDAHYKRISVGDGTFPEMWRQFEDGLKTKARFFSRSAHQILDQIFEGIESMCSVDGDPAVATAGPGTKINHLYRARVFQNEEAKLIEALAYPWQHLGSPPSERAGAGRMNSRGISVFYGASDAITAIKEVRPPVGSKVAVARFDILRSLRMLDLIALRSVDTQGSLFDPATFIAMQKGSFLAILSHAMSRAVMPHEEVSEYLTTQAVADYLAHEIGLDGIVYPSVQSGYSGTNVVLFHRSSWVEPSDLPPGSTVEASFDNGDPDDPDPQYSISEHIAVAENGTSENLADLPFQPFLSSFEPPFYEREATLRTDLDSIEVRHVTAVEFATMTYSVPRHRLERATPAPATNSKNGLIVSGQDRDDLI